MQYSVGLRDLCAIDVTEAPKRAGGEADLVGGRRVHIENKLSGTQLITHLRQFLVRVCRIAAMCCQQEARSYGCRI